MGVVLYLLFYGELPFGKNNYLINRVINNIIYKRLIFEEIESKNQEEKQINQKFVEIIKMCLIRDEKKRPTAKDIVRLL